MCSRYRCSNQTLVTIVGTLVRFEVRHGLLIRRSVIQRICLFGAYLFVPIRSIA